MTTFVRIAALGVGLTALSFAASINVALGSNGGVASQSSTYPGGDASKANDGDTNPYWAHGSVSHTGSNLHAWWEVAFNSTYQISSIIVYNRLDATSETRINPFSVFLYDSTNTPVFTSMGNNFPTIATPSMTFAVNNILANRLRIQLDGTNYLHLAEVQAMATPEPATYALMAGGLTLLGLMRRRKS